MNSVIDKVNAAHEENQQAQAAARKPINETPIGKLIRQLQHAAINGAKTWKVEAEQDGSSTIVVFGSAGNELYDFSNKS